MRYRVSFENDEDKTGITQDVDKTGITQVGSGDFSVISHTDNAVGYRVSFGNDKDNKGITQDVDTIGITQIGSGEFSVISHIDNAMHYRMSFRNDKNMPYCTCSSWKKSDYLCKHFFTVFLKFPNWSRDALSPLYVNSPFLQLDIYSKEKECSATEDLLHEPSNVENIEKEVNHSDEALQIEKSKRVEKRKVVIV